MKTIPNGIIAHDYPKLARGIAFFIPDLGSGGAERVVVNLANAIAASNLRTFVVLARKRGPLVAELHKNVNVVNLNCRYKAMAPYALAKWLRVARPSALSSHMDIANVVAHIAALLARYEGHLQHVIHLQISAQRITQRRLKDILVFQAARRLYRHADSLIGVSDSVCADAAEYLSIPRDRFTRIYNPIVGPHIAELSAEDEIGDGTKLNQPNTIVSAGRLHEQKDFETLLRAIAVLKPKRPIELAVLGEGPNRLKLENLARSLNIDAVVHFIGFVSNPFPFLSSAQLFVLSSKSEGFGNVLIEAMAVGTPVVSTDCPGGPREILDNGRYGELTPPGDAIALSEAIERTLDQPIAAETLRKRAALFSIEAATREYLRILGTR